MKKIDFKKDLKRLYLPSAKEVAQVDVPAMNFLMVDGQGDPNTSASYQEAVEALFSVAYAIKFKVKKTLAIDYGVLPLEGLWWADDMAAFTAGDKSDWKWTMMIMQPEFVNAGHGARHHRRGEKEKKPPRRSPRCVSSPSPKAHAAQILHIGPFTAEGPTVGSRSRLYRHGGQAFRQAPRDLSLRHPQGRSGQVEDRHPPAAALTGMFRLKLISGNGAGMISEDAKR